MATGIRRRAREAALKVLFQMDLSGINAEKGLSAYWESFDLEAEGDEYAEQLVKGIEAHHEEIDEAIREASTRWRLERMATVDRNVLRIGTYELVHRPDVPVRVVLDEAIELAKRFGGEDSSAFINGVLDRLAQTTRSEEGF
jgi:N utilization substance protein B